MPPACSLLGIATPTPPEVQPFRFFDLPIEIRYMVYEQLVDRDVTVIIPGFEMLSCDCISVNNAVHGCFYPTIMRVSRRMREEYGSLAMARLVLHVEWTCDESIFAQTRCLDLSIFVLIGAPQCEVQSAILAYASETSQLSRLLLTVEYEMEQVGPISWSTELGRYGAWKQETIEFLQRLVSAGLLWKVTAKFDMVINLYSDYLTPAERAVDAWPRFDIPSASFAVCNYSDKDTYKLYGLDLKFMGTNWNLGDRDANTQTIIIRRSSA
ncbi:hypothetical protein QM012_003649 [Aureobasidium pullulans]|uniref:Uncharacterized protein n=1 Tax=Aureobasidium pullulans TaxID=5580 RepID=A0ABR0T7I6_AURPU